MRKAKPKDGDAKAKYDECSKIVRQQAFEKAIRVDSAKSVADTLDWESMGKNSELVQWCVHVCLSLCASRVCVCVSVCLSVCLSAICPSVCLSVHVSACLSVCLCAYIPIHVYLPVCACIK